MDARHHLAAQAGRRKAADGAGGKPLAWPCEALDASGRRNLCDAQPGAGHLVITPVDDFAQVLLRSACFGRNETGCDAALAECAAPPNFQHATSHRVDAALLAELQLEYPFIASLIERSSLRIVPEFERSAVRLAFGRLGEEHAYRGKAAELGVKIASVSLLHLLAFHCPPQNVPAPTEASGSLASRLCRYIDERIAERWSIATVAISLGVSAADLRLACRRAKGCSPQQLARDRRLLEAKRRLRFTAMPVGRISRVLGFSSPSYFTRFFTASTGFTPSQFRSRSARGFRKEHGA